MSEVELSYEENILKLEAIIQRLEKGDITLEDGLSSFEEGISLIKKCQKQLERVFQKIQVLNRDGHLEDLAGKGEEAT